MVLTGRPSESQLQKLLLVEYPRYGADLAGCAVARKAKHKPDGLVLVWSCSMHAGFHWFRALIFVDVQAAYVRGWLIIATGLGRTPKQGPLGMRFRAPPLNTPFNIRILVRSTEYAVWIHFRSSEFQAPRTLDGIRNAFSARAISTWPWNILHNFSKTCFNLIPSSRACACVTFKLARLRWLSISVK